MNLQKTQLTKEQILNLDKKHRLHLINSISGYKASNVLGSVSKKGVENLGVFSSVVHLGSDPALLGFILRPTTVPRDTFSNLLNTGYVTINHVAVDYYKKAHQTSLSYPEEVSEFEEVGLTPVYHNNFKAPYIKEAPVSIGCSYLNHYPIKENGTTLVVLAVEELHIQNELIEEDYFIRLDKASVVTTNGLDGYAQTEFIERIPYRRYKDKA